MYTAYNVAHQILQIRNYVEVHVSGFAELPKDVLSALLHLTAEWRNVQEMETLIKMGANPREKHEGFTVLEMFVQGHDGTWVDKNSVKQVEEGVKMLSNYGVPHQDLTHRWILSNCKEVINNSEYLSTFFNVAERKAVVYYHVPGSGEIKFTGRSFLTVEEAVPNLHLLTTHQQYIAVIEHCHSVTRYLVSKGCGPMEVIPMQNPPGWSKKQQMVSNVVNFVLGNEDFPMLACEDDGEEDEDE